MAGAVNDYSFSHGMDIIKALPGSGEETCAGGLLHYWNKWPTATRGAFGYNSRCRIQDIKDGASQTFLLGEKAGSRLLFGGGSSGFPEAPMEISVGRWRRFCILLRRATRPTGWLARSP